MSHDIYQPAEDHYYVYVYGDPRKTEDVRHYITGEIMHFPKGTPFYVGKGKNKRAFAHLLPSGRGENRHKDAIINKIIVNGLQPIILCAWNGADEAIAYRVETLLALIFGLKRDGGLLTNMNIPRGERPPVRSGKVPKKILKKKQATFRANELRFPERKAMRSERIRQVWRSYSEEQRKSISDKNSAKQKGKPRASSSNPRSVATRFKTGQESPNTMDWLVTYPDGSKVEVHSLRKWCLESGLNTPTVCMAAKNGHKTRSGYRFEKLINTSDE